MRGMCMLSARNYFWIEILSVTIIKRCLEFRFLNWVREEKIYGFSRNENAKNDTQNICTNQIQGEFSLAMKCYCDLLMRVNHNQTGRNVSSHTCLLSQIFTQTLHTFAAIAVDFAINSSSPVNKVHNVTTLSAIRGVRFSKMFDVTGWAQLQ